MDYSKKDFTGRYLIKAVDLNGLTITGSCFSQEKPDTHVFPDDMSGVTFVNCNLSNVFIPDGNTLIDCQTTRYEMQNDLCTWEVDENGIPTNVTDYLHLYKHGIALPSPGEIPDEPAEKRVDYRNTARNVLAEEQE